MLSGIDENPSATGMDRHRGGTNPTAACAIAFSMPLPCMTPVNTPAASRIQAIISAARAWASMR